MHASKAETWIAWRTAVNRGWVPTPRHAHGGRHAAPAKRGGMRVLARVYGAAIAARMVTDAAIVASRPVGRAA